MTTNKNKSKMRSFILLVKKVLSVFFKLPDKYDLPLLVSVFALLIFGSVMIVSTSVGIQSTVMGVLKAIVKQGIFMMVGYCCMCFFANFFSMRRFQIVHIFAGILLIGLLAFTFTQRKVNGAYGWIFLTDSISIQPSEFSKVFMILVMALYVQIYGNSKAKVLKIISVPVLFYLAFGIIILLQPDLGTFLILSLITVTCCFIPSMKQLRAIQKIFSVVVPVGLCIALFFSSSAGIKTLKSFHISGLEHVAYRIEGASNPFLDPTGPAGYQLINGLYGFARGGLTGVGFGESIQKYGYLTQSENDFILSIIVEEWGLVGFGIILVFYFFLMYRLFYFALKAKSEGYKIILVGTALYIFYHFVLNVVGVTGLLPLTGVPLLLISSGGSSLISVMTLIGISQYVIAKIRKQGTVVKKTKKIVYKQVKKEVHANHA